jgi:hypothetical protein
VDFANALLRLETRLRALDGDWAVIGGLALAAHGAGRLTHDLDIVTEHRVQPDLVGHLESLGYETLHLSRGYSNHAHEDPAMGRIDVVYVEGPTAQSLFAEAQEIEIFAGVEARVVRPEHLVAMKVLAAKNAPHRRLQEMADVVALLRATGLDPEAVRQYFERHDMLDAWEEIRNGV